MPDADVPAEALALVERIARAIRGELGEEIDAYPGCRAPEGADPINRAYRAVVRSVLAEGGVEGDRLAVSVSLSLRLVASRRLEAEGWDDSRVKSLIEGEPGSPDDWLCFLALSSRAQVEPLLGPDPA